MKHDYVKAFEELKALAGKYYEDIDDPDKYIYELRHGERDEIAVQTRQDALREMGEWLRKRRQLYPASFGGYYPYAVKEDELEALERGEMPEQSGT